MATLTSITPVAACTRLFTPTPISTQFSELLGALARHIEAERDIADVDVWDPAFRTWLTDAEHSYDRVSTLVSEIRHAPLARCADLPLQRMATLLDAMIGSEEPGSFQRIHRMLPEATSLLHCPGDDAVAHRTRQMIATAFARIAEMAMLLTYADLDAEDVDAAARDAAISARPEAQLTRGI